MSAVTRSSIRSRLAAAAVAFLLGFVCANIGLFAVLRPDSWVWLAVGVVLMVTGVVAVLISDTSRNISMWAVLGLEIFAVFTLVPLLWTFSVATASPEVPRASLWPLAPDWSAFAEVVSPGRVRTALVTSLTVAAISSVVSMAAALPAATALVHRPVNHRRWWYLAVVAILVAPTSIFAAAGAAQLLDFGWSMSLVAMALPTLVISLPLAIFLLVRVFSRARWSLHDELVANGASIWQRIRFFFAPQHLVDFVVVFGIVFAWVVSDYALGAGLAQTERAQSLSAALLDIGAEPTNSRLVAAAGLWWLLAVGIFGAVFSRRIVSLMGRS